MSLPTLGGMTTKIQQTISQGLLDFARIAWVQGIKDSTSEAIYDDVLAKFDGMWGGHELFYRKSNSTITIHAAH